jgi:3-oxoacyl-[acyl-carrier protein] reductase
MNRAAIVTGASRGIGRGIALALSKIGYDLVINYNSNLEAAEETARVCREAKVRAEICQASIAEGDGRAKLIECARSKFGRVDLLVNNAGIAPKKRADILEATEESFDELMRTNVKGPYFLTQAVARWMAETKSSSGPEYRPKIVTISSISAYTASTNRGDYCLSKAALSMLTPLFAARLAEFGILVYEIRPGVIATDMTSAVQGRYDKLISEGLTPIQRWGQPEDIARAVVAIALDYLPFSTGEVINVDGGFHLRRL